MYRRVEGAQVTVDAGEFLITILALVVSGLIVMLFVGPQHGITIVLLHVVVMLIAVVNPFRLVREMEELYRPVPTAISFVMAFVAMVLAIQAFERFDNTFSLAALGPAAVIAYYLDRGLRK